MLCPLTAFSRASRRVLSGRLAREPRAWRKALPLSPCNHCQWSKRGSFRGYEGLRHLAYKQHGPDLRSRTHPKVHRPQLARFVHSARFRSRGFCCPRYDFSHFNRPWTRICEGASFIVILLPIAKITSQVSQSRSATDTAPRFGRFWSAYHAVHACLRHGRCTLKRECYKDNARPADVYAQ
jgi:hypothetical protein